MRLPRSPPERAYSALPNWLVFALGTQSQRLLGQGRVTGVPQIWSQANSSYFLLVFLQHEQASSPAGTARRVIFLLDDVKQIKHGTHCGVFPRYRRAVQHNAFVWNLCRVNGKLTDTRLLCLR